MVSSPSQRCPPSCRAPGRAEWFVLGAVVVTTLLAVALSPGPAQAQGDPGPEVVLAALHSDEGWVVHKLDGRGGVDIYRRKIPGVVNWVFKGVKDVDVDSTALFDAIIDIAHHTGLSRDIPLAESVVLSESGNVVDFFQLLDSPGWTLASDRYWFNRAFIYRDVDGKKGHHLQTWQGINPAEYPEQFAKVRAEHSSAILTPLNYGSWEVIPLGDARSRLIYRVASDPGGKLPNAAANLVTGRTLPDNLLQFEAEGKRRAGR